MRYDLLFYDLTIWAIDCKPSSRYHFILDGFLLNDFVRPAIMAKGIVETLNYGGALDV